MAQTESKQVYLPEEICRQAEAVARELAQAAHLTRGQIVVVGCSTSEVRGQAVGSCPTPEIAQAIYRGLQGIFAPLGVYVAAQCCEHLNRAIIVERDAVPGADSVNVVPRPDAGGSFVLPRLFCWSANALYLRSCVSFLRPSENQRENKSPVARR